jgi:hypothetical protein
MAADTCPSPPTAIASEPGPRPKSLNIGTLTHWNPWTIIQRQVFALLEMFNGLAYVLFLAINATLFLRPEELFPQMSGLHLYEGLMAGAGIGALSRIQRRLAWSALVREPVTLCVVGLLASIVLSHLSHFTVWWLSECVPLFVKVMVYYFLLVTLVDSPRRYRGLLYTVCLSGTVMVTACVIDYVGFHDFEFVSPLRDLGEEMAEGRDHVFIWRMRGIGLFQDPNDISLVIVVMGVLCAYFMLDERQSVLRFWWLIPLAILVAGLIYTRSRGGLLAGGAAGLTFLAFRYGRTVAILCAICGALALPAVAGRQVDINFDEGTGRDRLMIWRDGLELLKSKSAVFGIGHLTFWDEFGIVAHNSFVHAYVELGLFGGTLFFGCFYLTGLGLYRLRQMRDPSRDPELARFAPFLAAMLAGYGAGLFSLTRCYVVPTYLIIGLGAAYISLMNAQLSPPRFLVVWNRNHCQHLAVASLALLVGLNVMIKVLAR